MQSNQECAHRRKWTRSFISSIDCEGKNRQFVYLPKHVFISKVKSDLSDENLANEVIRTVCFKETGVGYVFYDENTF